MKNHSFIGLLGALLFSCFPFFNIAVCRDAPVTTVGSANPCPGNSITIPVYVDNFTNITAITLRIEYDPAVMTFNNFSGNPVLSGIIANAIPVGEGSSLYKVMIVWTDIHPKTLDNGSSIIDLAFSYLSGDGSLVFNNTSGGGGDCEYADETWMPMNDIPTEQFYHHGTILNAGAGPAGEISGSSVICQGSNNISYAVAPIANATGYTWSLPAGAAIASGENTNTIIVNFNPDANSGLISVFGYNTACLAGGTPSPDYWVTVHPLPTSALSGSTIICAGNTASLTIDLTGTAPWNITYTDGTNQFNINDIASSPYLLEVAPSETTSYWVTMVSDGNNCTGAGSGIATINVNPLPTASLSGSATICAGSSASLTVNLTGTAPWDITYTDGTNQFNINDIASSPYPFEVAPSETTSYWVTMVSDGNNCTGAGSGIATVNVNPLPTASLSGSATICAGNTASLTIDLTGTAPWNITYTDGSNQFNINDIASSPYLLEVAPSETTSYWVTMVSDGNNCTGAGSGIATVNVNPLPTASLSGSATICAGNTASLTVNLTGTAPWDLTYTDGTNQFNINDIAASPYPFEVAPSETTSYWVTMVSDGNNCTNTGSESITIEVNP
ncbi:MAG: cohesin domain-containing protein, partial [Bacteroidales bacterium]|nr:cohesin domain-containing protein [Bacteroidales bacterium]